MFDCYSRTSILRNSLSRTSTLTGQQALNEKCIISTILNFDPDLVVVYYYFIDHAIAHSCLHKQLELSTSLLGNRSRGMCLQILIKVSVYTKHFRILNTFWSQSVRYTGVLLYSHAHTHTHTTLIHIFRHTLANTLLTHITHTLHTCTCTHTLYNTHALPSHYPHTSHTLPLHTPTQEGIEPMWEDIRNKAGGRWLLNLDRKDRRENLDSSWLETVSACSLIHVHVASFDVIVVW